MPTFDPLTISIGANIILGLALIIVYVHHSGAITKLQTDTKQLFTHAATPVTPAVHVDVPAATQAAIDAAVAKVLGVQTPVGKAIVPAASVTAEIGPETTHYTSEPAIQPAPAAANVPPWKRK